LRILDRALVLDQGIFFERGCPNLIGPAL
jgi:hypothetical protein